MVQATTTLIYKIYREGFTGLDLASVYRIGGVDVPHNNVLTVVHAAMLKARCVTNDKTYRGWRFSPCMLMGSR